jgi:signal peptidase I
MEPAYRDGDRVLVRRGAAPRTGDVVVTEHPRARRGGDLLIKRVAAVPGEPIPRAGVPALAREPGTRVPAGHLVLLGDNRPVSLDSRELGYFPADGVLGRVLRPLPAPRGR